MDEHVPIKFLKKNNLKDPKLDVLISFFEKEFHNKLEFIVQVPGRVNLIGEHVDYSGFPVISMAIDKNILIGVNYKKVNSNNLDLNFHKVNLKNLNSNEYLDYSFNNTKSLDDMTKPLWYHYIMCGYKGVLENLKEKKINSKNDNNLNEKIINSYEINIAVSGDIPHSSGLSSSSALVCASAISFEYVIRSILNKQSNETDVDIKINKHEIASDCSYFERYIGTQGGGIDQAICLLAEENLAKLIKFKPSLNATSIKMPDDCDFFILHCGKTLNKASTTQFNIRVFETRVAAYFLKQNYVELKDKKVLLSDFTINKKEPFLDLIKEINEIFRLKEKFNIIEIINFFKLKSFDELCENINFSLKSLNLILESVNEKFEFDIKNRAIHVINEVNRVFKMQSINSLDKNEDKINLAGQLLNESHQSLSNLYQCSCEELDQLVLISNLSGSKGSKLTGAGWGGCIVAIVPEVESKNFENILINHSKFVIKTKAAQGSLIFKFES